MKYVIMNMKKYKNVVKNKVLMQIINNNKDNSLIESRLYFGFW